MNGQAANTAVIMNPDLINYVCDIENTNIQLKFNSKTYISTRNRTYEPKTNGSRYKRSLNKLSTDTTDRHKYITNLSTKTLTQCQSKVLIKGLAFISSSTHMNKSRLNDITNVPTLKQTKVLLQRQRSTGSTSIQTKEHLDAT